ncbi:transglycosylase family protein [Streptomyces sp. NPDC001404]|uniref:transglycosylase family protein n=1 Tax=Streptomyces sp. NPDC001404 TaxID=3364571 RepID=UPI0036C1290E
MSTHSVPPPPPPPAIVLEACVCLFARQLVRHLAPLTAALCLVCLPVPAYAEVSSLWRVLTWCESRGNWHANTGNGYYGGLQFAPRTWRSFGGSIFASRADLASPPQQIAIARRVLQRQGWHAWPECGRRLFTALSSQKPITLSGPGRPGSQHAKTVGQARSARSHVSVSHPGHVRAPLTRAPGTRAFTPVAMHRSQAVW